MVWSIEIENCVNRTNLIILKQIKSFNIYMQQRNNAL